MQRAVAAFRGGDLDEARRCCRKILSADPMAVDALHLAGVIALQSGRADKAVEFLRRAARLQPGVPGIQADLGNAHAALLQYEAAERCFESLAALLPGRPEPQVSLGNVLAFQGRYGQAVTCYRVALELAPDQPGIHVNLANALAGAGRLDDAEACLRDAVAAFPAVPEVRLALANVLRSLDYPPEAAAQYRQLLEAHPGSAAVLCGFGDLLLQQGDWDEAVASYEQAAAAQPDLAEPHVKLGNACGTRGRWSHAESSLRRALQVQPGEPRILAYLGMALSQQAKHDEALAVFQSAIAGLPNDVHVLADYGLVLERAGRAEEAVIQCQRILELKSDHPEALANLGLALNDLGRFPEAIEVLNRAVRAAPGLAAALSNLAASLASVGRGQDAVASLRRAVAFEPRRAWLHSNLLLMLHYLPIDAAEEVRRQHLAWGARHADPAFFAAKRPLRRSPHSRLRVGYVGADFINHSVAYFVEPVLAHHDREAFEVYCYANQLREDEVTRRLRSNADHWRTVAGMNDDELAQRIIHDEIDILVDLSGHTAGNRLPAFARRPAPVQITWIGYPDTTGMRQMDYRITDALADPPGDTERYHSEQLIRLDGCFCCYQPPARAPQVAPLPSFETGIVTFGSFNNPRKINDRVIEAWSKILHAVPGSRLLMKGEGLEYPDARVRFLESFATRGIDPARLGFAGREPSTAAHLGRYAQVDVGLDAFPYNGVTTTCEALWMGVPVVALAGRTHFGRTGVTLLTHAGLPELIGSTLDEYVEKAVRLARDRTALADLRVALRSRLQASRLLDAKVHARDVETAFRRVWERRADSQGASPPYRVDQSVALPMEGGLQVVAPDSAEQMTAYVLKEQGDWFEEEIRFVRSLLRPGMNTLDIGANYGAYTLTLARAVGGDGRVWAFEPAAIPADYLERSAALNQAANVAVIRSAVSDRSGTARPRLSSSPELNSLARGEDVPGTAMETVRVTMLDHCEDLFAGRFVDFLKIDVEGAESEVVRGGARFLSKHSPLVMFEISRGGVPNPALVEEFHPFGYSSYALVPGLGLLRPFDRDEPVDPFQLNLFCCRDDRAEHLEQAGYLFRRPVVVSGGPRAFWRNRLSEKSFAGAFALDGETRAGRAQYEAALGHYFDAFAGDRSPAERCGSLMRAAELLEQAWRSRMSVLRLSSLIRVTWQLGRRTRAIHLVDRALALLGRDGAPAFDEPFLPACGRYEELLPGTRPDEWLEASLVEQNERLRSFTSYTTPDGALRNLERLQELGFMSPEMERRRDALRWRFGV